MHYSLFIFLITICMTNTTLSSTKAELKPTPHLKNYLSAAQNYNKGIYTHSINSYKRYLENCKKTKCDTTRRLFSIDMLGTIYTRHLNDPSKIIEYLSKYKQNLKANDAITDELDDWLNAAREYKNAKQLASHIKIPEELIKLGDKYFKMGESLKEFPMDRAGNPHLSISSSYYLQYIYKLSLIHI